ncbi:hypothetical protein N7493_004848 [Penicillium malachiteum]|uniref:Uncharacterized protein n=1 Tax=Penicillium malachiteum TaxID=1324776 RepID=A0AAD6MXF2_9EURO|nr:hypothetical protein N7493_004848 [Penicillium malachiteum]
MVHWQAPPAPSSVIQCLYLPITSQANEDKQRFESIKYLLFTQLGVIYDADEVEPIKFTRPCKTFLTLMLDLFIELTFLNIKKFLDLMRLHHTALALGPMLPVEILDIILLHLPLSSLITGSQNMIRTKDLNYLNLGSEIAKLPGQIHCLFVEVEKLNPYIWKKLASYDLKDAVLKTLSQEEKTNYLRQADMSSRRYASYQSKTPEVVKFIKEKVEAM